MRKWILTLSSLQKLLDCYTPPLQCNAHTSSSHCTQAACTHAVHMHVHMHTHTHMDMYIHTQNTHAYIYAHTHTCTYAHIPTSTHTYTHSLPARGGFLEWRLHGTLISTFLSGSSFTISSTITLLGENLPMRSISYGFLWPASILDIKSPVCVTCKCSVVWLFHDLLMRTSI